MDNLGFNYKYFNFIIIILLILSISETKTFSRWILFKEVEDLIILFYFLHHKAVDSLSEEYTTIFINLYRTKIDC